MPSSSGNTPAEAGKTKHGTEAHSQKAKHPRRGGEDKGAVDLVVDHRETPPPRRGRPIDVPLRTTQAGNTPAEAGKTGLFYCAMSTFRKHPRRGGEDSYEGRRGAPDRETPPPRRGRPVLKCLTIKLSRNTPAEAGKTLLLNALHLAFQKHPRRGGED